MNHEEAFIKATRTFRDDEDDVLLRVAILKERADYRKYFTVELRKAVESAYSKIEEENTKGPGHFVDDEEVHNTSAHFLGKLRHRFGIQQLGIPPYRTTAEWLDVLDPRVDVRGIPAKVRRSVLPRLFYSPGIREVVSRSDRLPCSNKHPVEIANTTSTDCAPYERLWKIDLRKKPSQLVQEFKADLAVVDARRGMDPAAYKAWKQDRTRKRKEAWDHLKVWKMRRERKGFIEIARTLKIKTSTAKMNFYRAHELIEGIPYDSKRFKLENWNLRECKTCSDNPVNGGTCKNLCPDMEERVGRGKAYSIGLKTEQMQDLSTRDEWLTSEARELQTKEN